jgi:hypothetical protein
MMLITGHAAKTAGKVLRVTCRKALSRHAQSIDANLEGLWSRQQILEKKYLI